MFTHLTSVLSLQSLQKKLVELWSRFPMPVLISLFATGGFVAVFHTSNENILTTILKWELVAALAFSLVTLAALVAEKYNLSIRSRLAVQAVVVVISAASYFLLPESPQFAVVLRFVFIIVAGIILFISFPFDSKNPQGLWSAAGTFFRSMLVSISFAVGLGGGLSLALLATQYLFQLDWNVLTWPLSIIWPVAFGTVALWSFLANVPQTKDDSRPFELSKAVQGFIFYVWLPIVALFFVILYVYLGKIVLTWQWPNGGVAYWILAFALIGFAAYVVLYGILEEHPKLKSYFKFFFISVIPMTVVLFMSIGIRISQYGVTENRYLVTLFGIWLLVTSIYYLFSKQKKLASIPYLTAGFLLISIVGPWNMFAVSADSQTARLEQMLSKQGLLVGGKIVPLETNPSVNNEEYTNIQSTLEYVVNNPRGLSKIRHWFPASVFVSETKGDQYLTYNNMLTYLHLEMSGTESDNSFNFVSQKHEGSGQIIDVKGYDFVAPELYLYPESTNRGRAGTAPASQSEFDFALNDKHEIEISRAGVIAATIPLQSVVENILTKHGFSVDTVPANEMEIMYENSMLKIKVVLLSVSGTKKGDVVTVEHVDAMVLGIMKK
jgi:hypothetical protein